MAIPVPMEPLLPRKLITEKDKVENRLFTGDEKKLSWWGNLFPAPVAKIPHFCLFFFIVHSQRQFLPHKETRIIEKNIDSITLFR